MTIETVIIDERAELCYTPLANFGYSGDMLMYRKVTGAVGSVAETAMLLGLVAAVKVAKSPASKTIGRTAVDGIRQIGRAADMAVGIGVIGLSFAMDPLKTTGETIEFLDSSGSALGEQVGRGLKRVVEGVGEVQATAKAVSEPITKFAMAFKAAPVEVGTTLIVVGTVFVPFTVLFAVIDANSDGVWE